MTSLTFLIINRALLTKLNENQKRKRLIPARASLLYSPPTLLTEANMPQLCNQQSILAIASLLKNSQTNQKRDRIDEKNLPAAISELHTTLE